MTTNEENQFATIMSLELWVRGPLRYGHILEVLRDRFKITEVEDKLIIEEKEI